MNDEAKSELSINFIAFKPFDTYNCGGRVIVVAMRCNMFQRIEMHCANHSLLTLTRTMSDVQTRAWKQLQVYDHNPLLNVIIGLVRKCLNHQFLAEFEHISIL